MTKTEVIAENISHISFQYAEQGDDNEIEWFEEWEEEEHTNLPLTIRMTVEWKNGAKEYWLRRTCGVNYNSNFGNRSAATSTRATRTSNPNAGSNRGGRNSR